MLRYTALTTPLLGVVVGVASMFMAPDPAAAATDLGVSSELKGLYQVTNPAVTSYQGRRIMFMSGTPIREHIGLGVLYASVQTADGWSPPKVAFAKQGCALPVLEGAVSIPGTLAGGEPEAEAPEAVIHHHNGSIVADADVKKEEALFAKPLCVVEKPVDHPLFPGMDGKVEKSEIPFISAKISQMTRGYNATNPAIVKHPKLDQYYMFYTMRMAGKVKEVVRNPRNGAEEVKVMQPHDEIGVAYGRPCPDSPDGTGLCWTDLSAERPLISHAAAQTEDGVSAVLQGAEAALYYRTSAPVNQLVRTMVDIRDWRIKETTPLTFQEMHLIKKKWKTLEPHQQIGVQNIDVQTYGTGFMMVSNDYSSHAIGRWKSEDGINFYRDPYDANSPVIWDINATLADPYLETGTDNEFTVYYTSSGKKDSCPPSQSCPYSVVERRMSEEANPKIFENDYFSEDYVEPDYDAVQPAEDAYTKKQKKRR